MIDSKQAYLTKQDAAILKKQCRGCRYFKPDVPVKSICTLVGWYNEHNIEEVLAYVKKCPCNQRCLVKVSCMEESCPIWMEHVYAVLNQRSIDRLKEES